MIPLAVGKDGWVDIETEIKRVEAPGDLFHIDCKPYAREMYDATSDKMLAGQVFGYYIRVTNKKPPQGTPALEFDDRWIVAALDWREAA